MLSMGGRKDGEMNVGCSLVDEMTSASLREAPDGTPRGTSYHASPLKLLLSCVQ